ncbi:MAG: NAD-dependent epimerase/dehydratase family protein [Candidatus Delongbacteria bacterium]|nr:NAD-dependent epimerase/dehydratase family protein [Candidatus Delongbacteria bacterium]
MHKKCLIVGGGGFIGLNLFEYLSSKNFYIKIIDKYTNNIKNLHKHISHVDIINLDVKDTNKLLDHLGDIENIIWLIHTSVPSSSMDNIETDLISNLLPLIKFLTRIKTNSNIERFVYLSSGGTIYGNSLENKPFVETSPTNPISSYGLTKLVAEKYIDLILHESTIQRYILRPSNVYGLYQNLNKPQGIIGHAFKAAINNHPIVLYNNGIVTRDFLFVSDLVDAIHKCLIHNDNKNFSFTFNVGSQKGYTINEIIKAICGITSKEIITISKPDRGFDCNFNVLDSSKIFSDLNWSAHVGINDGLVKVWEWIKNVPNV